jgi:hypothetical protein
MIPSKNVKKKKKIYIKIYIQNTTPYPQTIKLKVNITQNSRMSFQKKFGSPHIKITQILHLMILSIV